MLDAAESNGFEAGKVLADTGYYSEANVEGAQARNVEPYIAVEKQSHGIKLESILEDTPGEVPELPTNDQSHSERADGIQTQNP